jgi:hypothetical protein
MSTNPRSIDRYPPHGLVAGLTFDRGNAYDVTGGAWTPTGSPTFGSGVITLNGSTQYIVANSSSVGSVSGDFSAALWFNVDQIPPTTAYIPLSKFIVSPDGDAGYALLIRNNASLRVVFRAGTGSGQDIDTSLNSISATTWTHVVFNRSGTTFKIYINGTESVSATVSGNSITNSMPMHIGAFKQTLAGSVSNFWPGKIDEVRIYNRALTATEIAQIYQTTRNIMRP